MVLRTTARLEKIAFTCSYIYLDIGFFILGKFTSAEIVKMTFEIV